KGKPSGCPESDDLHELPGNLSSEGVSQRTPRDSSPLQSTALHRPWSFVVHVENSRRRGRTRCKRLLARQLATNYSNYSVSRLLPLRPRCPSMRPPRCAS